MQEKKERQRKILPPLEDLIGGSTSDLVSEALKKVIPYSLETKDEEGSVPDTSPALGEIEENELHQREENKIKDKASTRMGQTRVRQPPAIGHPSMSSPAATQPGSSEPELGHNPALQYPSTTYVSTPCFLLDELLPTLNPYEQVLLIRLYRLSYGVKEKITDHVGKKTLSDKCNMSVAMVKKVLKRLESRGLIETIPDRSNDPTKGNKYRVLARVS